MPIASFSGDQRRRVAYRSQAGATSLRVPLETDPEGDWRDGFFDVAVKLAEAKADTNERHQFEKVVRENFNRWTEWLRARGWEYVTGSLQVMKPQPVPTPNVHTESDPELRRVHLLARFKRSTHLYVGLDDLLYLQDMAEVYGVKPNPMPWNTNRDSDSGWVDPVAYAEERRKALGINRKDYLFD